MAEPSLAPGSPGDPYQGTDQDEPMDTDSEREDESRTANPAETDRALDTDSVQMEISDNEGSDQDVSELSQPKSNVYQATQKQLIPAESGNMDHKNIPAATRGAPQGHFIENVSARPNRGQSSLNHGVPDIHSLKEPIHGLTVPLWQRVFLAVPPVSLGRLLVCSRVFHAILAPRNPVELAFQQRFQNEPDFVSSEAIWQGCRNRFASNLPKPLINKSELDMWRLLRGDQCQACQQKKTLITSCDAMDPWQSGPGSTGIRVVWPCGIRICGPCLIQRCQQEVSLQLSSTFPSFLIQALPALLLTQFDDWVPESILLTRPPLPHLQIRKLYYQPQIDAILLKFKKVKDLGEAAAEEWIKGLGQQRSDILEDASRWEQWEARGGLNKVNARQSPKPLSMMPPTVEPPRKSSMGPFQPTAVSPPPSGYQDHGGSYYPSQGHRPNMLPMAYAGTQTPGFSHFQAPSMVPGPPMMQNRPRRSLQEVNEARAARRREIERRCLELDPPISSKVLAHMQSFQAALQISFPFTDKDWEVLKPRLLAQREVAEAQEAMLAEQLRAIQTTAAQPSLETLLVKDPNDLPEDHWELLQKPLHEKLGQYADEHIRNAWEDGTKLTKETASHFAADILLTARNRYYESFNQVVNTNVPAIPRIPVSLESMKWLYDNKIKGTAEIYQKDLFVCNGCDASSKLYGFEGVIQHYAAKHTTVLSLGNVIVNWRTEWPDVPPFAPYLNAETNGWNGQAQYQGSNSVIPTYASGYAEAYQGQPSSVSYPVSGQAHYQGQYMHYQQAPPPYGLTETGVSYPNYSSHGGPAAFSHQSDYAAVPGSDRTFPAAQIPYLTSQANDQNLQQLAEMAQISRDLWNATMGIKELQPSIRISVLIKHMSTKFEKKFSSRPDISMFLHGLNENAQMRPIRSLNGLICKACSLQTSNHYNTADRKSFTLPALVNHFRNIHLGHAHGATNNADLDWRLDMIEIPENSIISNLVTSNGMDDRKFHLIAEVFPDAFPSPLPSLGALKEAKAKEEAVRVRLENLRAPKTGPVTPVISGQRPVIADAPRREEPEREPRKRMSPGSSTESNADLSKAPGEDEYDPMIPSFFGQIIAHSGLPRSSGTQDHGSVALPPGIISLGVVDTNDQPQSPHTQGGYADRLLRHHRGLPRHATDPAIVHRNSYPPKNHGQVESYETSFADTLTADRFLNDLASSGPVRYDRNVVSGERLSSLDDNVVHYAGAMRSFQGEPAIAETQRQQFSQPVEHHGNIPVAEYFHNGRQFEEERYYQGDSVDKHRANTSTRAAYGYTSRDRSRSPRRSLPRDHAGYDPNAPSPVFEERFDVRWRGETPSRGRHYRGDPEIAYVGGSGDGYSPRDSQRRNVRYVAMPIEEYEARTGRYIPPGHLLQNDLQPGEVVDTRHNGSFYVLGERDTMRYADGSAERHYRDYN